MHWTRFGRDPISFFPLHLPAPLPLYPAAPRCPHGMMVVKDLGDAVRCGLAYCPSCSPADAARWGGVYWLAGVLDRLEDVTVEYCSGCVSVEASCPCCGSGMDVRLLDGWEGWQTYFCCKSGCGQRKILAAIGLGEGHLRPWGWRQYWDQGTGPLPERRLAVLA